MKRNLKRRMAVLPFLACSSWALADPFVLDGAALDRVTAGSQSVLEQISVLLSTVPGNTVGLKIADLLPALGADQLASIAKLTSEPITFQLLKPGELVANYQLAGEQLVLVKQLNPGDASTMSAMRPGDSVKTYFLNPGESLRLLESSPGGTSYLYVHSSGNSTVSTIQKSGQ